MTIHYETREDFLFATSHDLLQRQGVNLEIGTDFEEYRGLLAIARPDHQLGEPFEPTKYNLNEHNALWMVGRDHAGKIIHTQAMRCLNLTNMFLSTFLERNLRQFEPSGLDIDYERSVYWPGPAAKRMMGTIVYHGEFWVGGPARQGTVLSPALGRHAFLTALRCWRPDYTFGFIAKRLAYKGFSARFGFLHNEPNAIKYVLKGTGQVFEGTMGYMSREDLQYVLDAPVPELMEEAA